MGDKPDSRPRTGDSMKIAVIRQKYVNYGGAESFLAQYTSQLALMGHEVHIFANQWTPPDHSNIRVHRVGAVKINSFIRSLSFAWLAAREVRKHPFDIIQSHERTFYQDIYRAGDGCHREWLEQRKKHLSPFKRWLLDWSPFHRLILSLEKGLFEKGRCRKIIAISEMVKKDILRHYRIPEQEIAVVYNGVSLERFHPRNRGPFREPVRERHGIPGMAVLILFVGSGFERKGLRYLMQSLKYLKSENWRLLLVGKGDWDRYLSFAPVTLRSRITCVDPVNTVEEYYAAADLFVLPSLYEPFGNVHLEAMASGLPVIASGRSGAAEIIGHGENGLVVRDPSDPKEIAENINLLFDSAVREAMGEKARVLAEKFTPERNAGEMLKIYRQMSQTI